MRKPDRFRSGPVLARELPWWTRPSAAQPAVRLAHCACSDLGRGSDLSGLEVRSRNYLSAPYIALYVGLVLVSAVGAWLGENVRQRALLQSPVQHLVRAAIWVGVLVLATYLFWYRSLMFDPALLISVLMGGEKPERTDIGTVTGITSLVNLAPVFFCLAGYLLFVRRTRDRTLVALTIVLLLFTFFRAYIWSERLAVAEAVIPLALALLGNASAEAASARAQIVMAPRTLCCAASRIPVLRPGGILPELVLLRGPHGVLGFRVRPVRELLLHVPQQWCRHAGDHRGLADMDVRAGAAWLHSFPLGIGPWFSETVGLHTPPARSFSSDMATRSSTRIQLCRRHSGSRRGRSDPVLLPFHVLRGHPVLTLSQK